MTCLCQNCRDPLPTSKKNPDQRFCGKKDCQRARKSQWQREKIHNDPDYKQNQQEANRNWQKHNPQYWQEYRQKNPKYTERNKEKSKQYMQIKRQVVSILKKFAKMDASMSINSDLTGYYLLLPVGEMFAKMDVKFLNISACQENIEGELDVCKERTV